MLTNSLTISAVFFPSFACPERSRRVRRGEGEVEGLSWRENRAELLLLGPPRQYDSTPPLLSQGQA